MSTWVAVAVGVIPSIGVGLIFWFAIRAVIRADRNERAALAQLELEQGDDAPAGSDDGVDDAPAGSSAPGTSPEAWQEAPGKPPEERPAQ